MKSSVYKPEQPIEVTLTFKDAEEINDLLESLTRWTPTGGWPENATEFFDALKEAVDESE